jgi:hypothetical protein
MTAPLDLALRLRELLAKATPGPNGCLEFDGPRTDRGYGLIYYNGKHTTASRVVLELTAGRPLLGEENACHSCDNPPCINPAHLFVGTQVDNMQDMLSKGRGGFGKSAEHTQKLSDSVKVALREGRLVVRRGESCPTAKLTETDVREIRLSQSSQRALAAQFGVSQRNIGMIKRGKAWRHVE